MTDKVSLFSVSWKLLYDQRLSNSGLGVNIGSSRTKLTAPTTLSKDKIFNHKPDCVLFLPRLFSISWKRPHLRSGNHMTCPDIQRQKRTLGWLLR